MQPALLHTHEAYLQLYQHFSTLLAVILTEGAPAVLFVL